MDTIVSKSNEKVKYIKSLNEKKFRQKYNAFYVEGIKVVEEILNLKKAIDVMFIAYSEELLERANGGNRILDIIKLKKESFEIINFSKEIFEYITDTKTPQGVLVVIRKNEKNVDNINYLDPGNIIVLDRVQDAGNIGTIIRTAEAFDISTIICIEGTTDIYSPKVVRSTMGSLIRENVIYCKENQIERFFNNLKENKYTIYSAVLEESAYVEDIKFDSKSVFVFGNEANGVSEKIKRLSDRNIKIEMGKNTESLNVSVAAGIVMYKQYIDCKN